MIYAIGQIHLYDRETFYGNVYMNEGTISPRYYLDALFSIIMRSNGGNWQSAAVFFVHFGVILLAVATTILVHKLVDSGQLFFTVILSFFFVMDVSRQAGGFDTFNMLTIGMGIAYAFVILAIAFAAGEKKNFNLSWIMLVCAILFHVHEGLYGFAIVCIFLVVDVISRRKFYVKENYCVFLYITVLLAVVMPNMLTDALNISNKEFVWIYANYRHPHHLVVSTWNKSAIFNSLIVILLPGMLRIEQLLIFAKKDLKEFIGEFGLFILMWGGVYAVMYFGTEKLHIVSITVMFLSKFFKYVAVVSLIWYMKTANVYFRRGEFLAGFFVLSPALIVYIWDVRTGVLFALCIIAYIYYSCINDQKKSAVSEKENSIFKYLAGCVYAALLCYNLSGKSLAVIGTVVFLTGVWTLFLMYSKKTFKVIAFLSIMALFLGCSYGTFYWYSDGKVSLISSTDILINSSGKDIYQLAQNFGDMTEKTDGYIVDSADQEYVGWFQIISGRNCYAFKKVVPSSKSMMQEWYDRCQQTEKIFKKDISEIIEIMSDSGNSYILVGNENYDMFDTCSYFCCFTECNGDTYRIYQLLDL